MPQNFPYCAAIVVKTYQQFTPICIPAFRCFGPLSSEPKAELQQLSILIHEVTTYALGLNIYFQLNPTHRLTIILLHWPYAQCL